MVRERSPIGVVDHYHIDWSLTHVCLQPKLLLERIKKTTASAAPADTGGASPGIGIFWFRGVHSSLINVVSPFQSRHVDNWDAREDTQ